METYTIPKELVKNPDFEAQKQETLAGLKREMIDVPIVAHIEALNRLPYCFTLQCCYGHFLYISQPDPQNLAPLPVTEAISQVEYRIAYLAFCVENSLPGRRLLQALESLTAIDPDNIQFCSAEWFWERQANSYALQVEPERYKHQDKATLEYVEALHIQGVRDKFYEQLERLLLELHEQDEAG